MILPLVVEIVAQPTREPASEDADKTDGSQNRCDFSFCHTCSFEEEASELEGLPWNASETSLDHQDGEGGFAEKSHEPFDLCDALVLATDGGCLLHSHRWHLHEAVDQRREANDCATSENESQPPAEHTAASARFGGRSVAIV